jgi:cell division protein FtsQ
MKQTVPVPVPAEIKLMNTLATALFVTFSVLLTVAVASWLLSLKAFAIQGITVTGEVTHNNAVTLRANVAPQLSGTFFTLDLGRARRVFEAVPWVRQAVVRREFPNRLRVQLQEHKAVAFWGAEGESRLLNTFGEVFEANVGEVEQDGLPRLNGPDLQSAQVLAMYQSLQEIFENMDLSVELLELSSRGGWRVRLDTGAAIELGGGSAEEVQTRTQRFLKTLTQVSSRYGRNPEALETADLRHENGYALRLRGVTTSVLDEQKK